MGQHKKSQCPPGSGACSTQTCPGLDPPALALSWNKCSPPSDGRAGIPLPAAPAIPPGGVSACEDSSALPQDPKQAFPEPEKHLSKADKFWVGGDFTLWKGNGVYSQYFSNIALPFCGLAKTVLRDIIKVLKKHLSLLKQSCFAILLFCCSFIILCK